MTAEVQAAIVFQIADRMVVDHVAALISGSEDRSVPTVVEQHAGVDLAIFRVLNRAKKPIIMIDWRIFDHLQAIGRGLVLSTIVDDGGKRKSGAGDEI